MQSYKYQHYDKKHGVGVANFKPDSEKIDIITYINDYYVHKQLEIRNNLLFMRIKKRLVR